jgi:hypothetical protein
MVRELGDIVHKLEGETFIGSLSQLMQAGSGYVVVSGGAGQPGEVSLTLDEDGLFLRAGDEVEELACRRSRAVHARGWQRTTGSTSAGRSRSTPRGGPRAGRTTPAAPKGADARACRRVSRRPEKRTQTVQAAADAEQARSAVVEDLRDARVQVQREVE